MTTCPKCRRTYADGVRFCPADGTLIAQVVDPYLGRVLMGQFKLVAQAGRGAMGTVYRAEQSIVGRTVAVKVLRADLLRDESAVKRFLREAQAAARLSHPNIVNVHLVGETDEGVPFIVMEYVEGATLGAVCQKLGLIEPRRALRLARQIASALSEAHGQGIVHRDLKADNILLAERPRGRSGGGDVVKVLDFGIAKLLDGDGPGGAIAQLTREGTIFGTPHYIAPEQATGQDVDGRADLYSLGVILYRMVTGQLPFDGPSGMQVLMRHVREVAPPPRQVRPDVPGAVEALVLTAIEKRREDRFADAESFIAAIDEVDKLLGEEAGRTLLGLSPPGASALAAAAARVAGPHAPVPTVVLPAAVSGGSPAGPATPRLVPQTAADDPSTTRGGEAGLDSWAARPLPDEVHEDDLYAPPPRSRALWLGVGATAVLLLGVGIAVARFRGAHPSSEGGAAPPALAAAPAIPSVDPPLVEEHVASAAGMAMRAGFEAAPAVGGSPILRVQLVDAAGHAVTGARVEATVRRAGERDEAVALAAESGRYRGAVPFRSGGRHALRVVASPSGGPGRVTLDFEVDLPGGAASAAPRAISTRPAAPAGLRRGRHVATLGQAASGGKDEELPVTLIPASSSSSDPITPRALGPAPDAARGGTPRGPGKSPPRTP